MWQINCPGAFFNFFDKLLKHKLKKLSVRRINDTEVSFVSGIKLAAITMDGGIGKGSAFRAMPIQKFFLVSGIKLAAITIDGGKGKGSAFSGEAYVIK